MNRCRDFFAGLLRKYPCCGAFCAIAVTTIPFLLRPGMPFPLLMIPASIFLILAGFFVSGRDGLFRLALPALAASVSVFLHQRMYLGDPLMDAFYGGPGRADAVIRIEDTSAAALHYPGIQRKMYAVVIPFGGVQIGKVPERTAFVMHTG